MRLLGGWQVCINMAMSTKCFVGLLSKYGRERPKLSAASMKCEGQWNRPSRYALSAQFSPFSVHWSKTRHQPDPKAALKGKKMS